MQARLSFVLLLAACAGTAEPIASNDSPHVDRVERRPDGNPYFLTGTLARVPLALVDANALAPVLPDIAAQFHVSAQELVATGLERDPLGMTHVSYVQERDGLTVVGGDLVVHVAADGVVRAVNGFVRDELPSSTPSLDAATAAQIALAASDAGLSVQRTQLVYEISTADDRAYLAWQVDLGNQDFDVDRVFVEAHAGDIVDRHPQFFTARARTIFDAHGATAGPFNTGQTQVGSETSPPTEEIALAAFTNTGLTYDCYSTLFQRDSYDGAGGGLKSVVHIKFRGQGGTTSGNNAAWTGNQMVYGDGDGTLMTPLARSLDVTAHELTHGVTSSTAMLAYQNESGALNEGMSDIMGSVVEAWHDGAVSADTWKVGEDIFTPAKDGDALRYMNDPSADAALYPPAIGGSRDFYGDRYQGTEDQGGVHLNSGIPNLAFYLLVAGGKHPHNKTTFTVPGIGIAKAGAIFERALVKGYFTMNTTLAQARTATEQTAKELYPGTEAAVGLAWAAVGVGQPPAADTVPPTVHITSPANNANVSAGFSVAVDASDDHGVTRVDLAVDGTVVGSVTAAPYTFTTAATLAAGTHTLTATAYDVFNHADDSVSVTLKTGCTMNDPCGPGETCNAGVCEPGNPDNGDTGSDDAGCGCRTQSAPASWPLWLGVALWLGRRRRRASTTD